MQSSLLALDHAGVAGQEARLLESGAIGVTVDLVEGSSDAQTQGSGLSGDTTAVDAGDDIETPFEVEDGEGSPHELLVQLVGEVVLQAPPVEGPLTGAGNETDAGNGFLAADSVV